jgi:hypothetical protein
MLDVSDVVIVSRHLQRFAHGGVQGGHQRLNLGIGPGTMGMDEADRHRVSHWSGGL